MLRNLFVAVANRNDLPLGKHALKKLVRADSAERGLARTPCSRRAGSALHERLCGEPL